MEWDPSLGPNKGPNTWKRMIKRIREGSREAWKEGKKEEIYHLATIKSHSVAEALHPVSEWPEASKEYYCQSTQHWT